MDRKLDITQKIDAITKIGKERLAMGGAQKPPKSVKIELTARCNLRCNFCALHTRDEQPKKDMDIEFFKSIVDDMRMSGVEEIGLFYLGESFMAKDLLIEATDYCKKFLEFPHVFLTSNAVFANPEVVLKVMNAGLDSLKWSLNYEDAESFNKITGGSDKSYKKALSNVVTAKLIRDSYNLGTTISASSIMFQENQHEIMKEFIETKVKPHVDKHYWLPMYQMAMQKEQVISETGYYPTGGNMGRVNDETMKPTRDPLPCWAVFTEGHVRVDGHMSACCFGSDDTFDVGLLNGNNFMKVWNSLTFQKLRNAHINVLNQGPSALIGTPCEVCISN